MYYFFHKDFIIIYKSFTIIKLSVTFIINLYIIYGKKKKKKNPYYLDIKIFGEFSFYYPSNIKKKIIILTFKIFIILFGYGAYENEKFF